MTERNMADRVMMAFKGGERCSVQYRDEAGQVLTFEPARFIDFQWDHATLRKSEAQRAGGRMTNRAHASEPEALTEPETVAEPEDVTVRIEQVVALELLGD